MARRIGANRTLSVPAGSTRIGTGVEDRAGVLAGRRRVLPGSRAVAGGFLIALAALIVFAAALASTGHHSKQYVVAAQPLAAGSVIGPGDLRTASMTLTGPARADVFGQVGTLIGRTVSVPVSPGELIESAMLQTSATANAVRPVSVAVDPDSLDGIRVGDPVDVLSAVGGSAGSSSSSGTSPTAQVTVVVRGATLLAISSPDSGLLSGASSGTVVTIGVQNLAEVEAVVAAGQGGAITLVQAEPSDGVGPGSASSAPTTTVPSSPTGP